MPATGGSGPTARILRVGSLVSGAMFVAGLALAATGRQASGPALDPAQVLPGLFSLDPRAWLGAATIILIATPVVALAATAIDYRGVERRSSYLAILLIVILMMSIIIAIRV